MRTWGRIVGVIAIVTVALGTGVVSATAQIPKGSTAEVILETGSQGPIGDPGYAIVRGWWGREGGSHTGTTYISVNAADAKGIVTTASVAALHQALHDGGSFGKLRVAFVPASADGSTERPVVHAGESAGEAFKWWTDMGVGSGVGGGKSPYNGTFVSTQRQWDKFWHAGRPVQAFDAKLVLHDVSDGAVSTTPEGTSILNTWPAGTKISVVLYVSDGYNNELEPLVKVGPDGRAISAWLTLRTIAQPGSPVRSSAGYQVLTASPGEGRKLVNGLPPAGARFNPVPSDSSAAGPSSASPSPSVGSATASGTTSATAAAASVGGSDWTWIWVGLALVVIAGGGAGFVIWRGRSPHGIS